MRTAIKGLAKKKLIYLSSLDDPITQLCEQAEREPVGKMKVHPAYLEARRVFMHFAGKVDVAASPSEETATPGAPHSADGRRTRGTVENEAAASSSPAPSCSPITRRKAINTGQRQ
ncbi:MAG: hypothetical protein CVU22_14115 [Betaproteobacteria bacterium HGW-Betaproteobacteria-16]|nr:MAG: hypothetical protein CVU22_14115 [Betaproteobacteria bacterium HGW-Betaproteobacteria-16]